MTTFKVNDRMEIRCTQSKTRNGFCHRATLYTDGIKSASSIASYKNRTWESYEYESVLSKLLNKTRATSADQSAKLLKAWGSDPELNGMGALNSLAMVMKMGEVLATLGQEDKADAQKKTNDWKMRMLKAGVPEGAIILPDNWDQLPEEEKERRLNGIIDIFTEKK